MGASDGRSSVVQILLHTLQMLARVLALGAALVIGVWLLYLGTLKYREDKPWQVFPPDYGCDERLLFDSCTVQQLIYMWLLPALLAFACLGLLVLRARLNSHEEHRKGLMGRLSTRLLPPKRFWLWWCGGLSVSDALAVAFWLAFNASWAVAVLSRFFSLIPFFSKLSENTRGLELQLVAVACGVFLLPNFVLLFYPVTRGSVVLQASGLSYPDAIRYHRWLGHAVMVLATAHSLGFWGIWLYQGKFVEEAFDQGPVFNNLAGGVSFLGGLALWLSSLEVARRTNYEVFYKLHHIGFWIFTFAGCCHFWEMFWCFLPGLVLYGVDGVYRIHQGLGLWGSSGSGSSGSNGGFEVLEAVASQGKTTCSLLLAAPRFGIAASGFVWINVPEISWHSWHPFEYFAVPSATAATAAGGCCGSNGKLAPQQQQQQTAMLLHIKGYDRWTKQLVELIANKGVNFIVKIEGPYAELPGAVLGHPEVDGSCCKHTDGNGAKADFGGKTAGDHAGAGMDGLVIAAGGVGATAAMSVFQELATSGEAVRGLPTLLLWCCRKADELEFLAPRLFSMANTLGLSLTVKLFCTGDPGATSGAALAAASPVKPAAAAAAGSSVTTSPPVGRQANGSSSGSSSGGGLVTSSMCPVVGLRSFWCQVGHKTLLHVIAFAGTFCAILAVRYMAEVEPARSGTGEPWTTAQKGSALVLLISAAILIPGMLALWAAIGVQAWQQRRSGSSGSSGSNAGGQLDGTKKELSRHLLADEEGTPAATPTAAAAAAASNSLAAAATTGGGVDALSAVAAAAAAAGGCATIKATAGGAGWELVMPEGAGDAAVGPYGVEKGRPPVQQLVSAWLAALQQLPTDQQLLQVGVYGMGPSKLVEDVKLLCDVINGQQGGSAGPQVYLGFVQKTHEL